jgi:predicted LPLAT superfamily acyltransferase
VLDEPEILPTPEPELSASQKRLGTESDGLSVLLEDKRMQALDLSTKKRILELLMVSGAFKPQSFDAVMTIKPAPPLTVNNIEDHIDELTLIEMKTTRAAIKNAALNSFFFGATDNEFQMAKALKDRYAFAFVVLNDDNDYGHPFFVLLTLEQLQAKTRTSRIQYQINFRSNMPADDPALPNRGVGPSPVTMPQ